MSKVKQAGIRFFPLGEWIIRKGREITPDPILVVVMVAPQQSHDYEIMT
jgi:hypothetical protein